MAGLSISKAWDETKQVIARDGRLFMSVALAFLVLPQSVLGAFSPTTPAQIDATFWALLLIALLAALIAQIALNRLGIPPGSTVGAAISTGTKRLISLLLAYLPVFFAVMLVGFAIAFIAVAAGLAGPPVEGGPPPLWMAAVLIFSLIFVHAIFQLVVPITAAEGGSPLRLLSRAWVLGKPAYWRLVAFLTLVWTGMLILWVFSQVIAGATVTVLLGAPERASIAAVLIALVIAVVQAAWSVVTAVMLARIYTQLAGAETSVPSSGT